jgi:hypothetical protein
MAEGKLTIKLSELVKADAALNQICKMDLVGNSRHKLARIYKTVEKEITELNESKQDIEKKYGKHVIKDGDKKIFVEYGKLGVKFVDEEGKVVKLERPVMQSDVSWQHNSEEDYKAWEKEMEELMDSEIEIDVRPVDISEIKVRENNQEVEAPLKPAVIAILLDQFLTYTETDAK